ncbi:glycosyltransferase family 39 protein [Candidatus Roizmanbacteria bacterium]|nr:glycosyltransferase family 39 protein [Candidatus Roizmanbacteria bacterium]
MALVLSLGSTAYFYSQDFIIAYGDAESHLNIAKRVIHGLTPGFAQLGGIWLPLPHILMIPFVYFDFLWRSGLAGSIVSGVAFLLSSIYIYKLVILLTNNKYAAFLTFLVFALNPNILYLQSTPMTELPLTTFFILSSYFFIKYIKNNNSISSLLLSSFFGFCAVLTRYDGWFLVLTEALSILLLYFRRKENWKRIEGKVILFSTLAFFGIFLWMMWDFLILGDPFYFTNSQFSSRTQQQNWLARGELPAYRNLPLAFVYYLVTSMSNSGVIVFLVAIVGFYQFLINKKDLHRLFVLLILIVPFIFNVFALFAGQSVIFIPHLTPVGFEWRLFNVRYGAMMIPVVSLFFGYTFYKAAKVSTKTVIIFLFLLQFGLYIIGYSKIITLADGTEGLSRARRPDAEYWIKKNYDNGLVLVDDYARTLSIIRSGIPMQNIIYIGNKPYWEESLVAPERYARWIIMQKDDDVWKHIYDKPNVRDRLFKYFQKTYTSPQILIFRRI